MLLKHHEVKQVFDWLYDKKSAPTSSEINTLFSKFNHIPKRANVTKNESEIKIYDALIKLIKPSLALLDFTHDQTAFVLNLINELWREQ